MIPQIVMDGLEMPPIGARLDIDGDHGIPEQVRPVPVSAVETADRRRERQVHEAALLVEREVEGPGVDAEAIFPALALPCVVTRCARLWNRAELPQLRAGARIERAGIADAADGARRRVRADNDDVPVHERHGVVRHSHVYFAVVAEARGGGTRACVERDQTASGRDEDARRDVAAARPICDAATRRRRACDGMLPDFFSRFGLERHDAVRGRQIHDAVDDNRRRLGIEARGAAPSTGRRRRRLRLQAIRPHLRQLRDVLRVDLPQRRVAAPDQISSVHRPVALAPVRELRLRSGGADEERCGGRQNHPRAHRVHQPRCSHESAAVTLGSSQVHSIFS